MLDRRKLLVGATALAGYSALARAAVPYEWQTTTPAEAGFVPGFGERLDQFILSGQAPNIHGVIIARRKRLVFENYYEGDDQLRDEHGIAHFERVAFSAERSHELRSVSKSIVGLLYGIALRAERCRRSMNRALRNFRTTPTFRTWSSAVAGLSGTRSP